MAEEKARKSWSSRWGFLFAAMGVAIGLGNLWRFPYIAGEYGGGAFVLVYIAFVFFICMPIMIGELTIGRLGGESAVGSIRRLITGAKANGAWRTIGWLSVIIPFIGLSYYSVVAGWAFFYGVEAAQGSFTGLDGASSAALFDMLMSRPALMIAVHGAFMAVTIFIVARGIKGGIETASKILMPTLFGLLLVLVVYNIFAGGFGRAVTFLFTPDFSKLTFPGVMAALGQAFFSVAVGVGAMITYGAYLDGKESLPQSALIIVASDTCVALLAGLAIFPILFANGLEPTSGPPLIFITLPVGFGQIFGGQYLGLLFFVLLLFAALTTSIGMLEPVVSWLEEKLAWPRWSLALLAGAGAWAFGLLPLLSFNVLSDVHPVPFVERMANFSIFDTVDFMISSLLLPFNGLLIALFAGWILTKAQTRAQTGLGGLPYFGWRFVVRFAAPAAVIVILWNGLVN